MKRDNKIVIWDLCTFSCGVGLLISLSFNLIDIKMFAALGIISVFLLALFSPTK